MLWIPVWVDLVSLKLLPHLNKKDYNPSQSSLWIWEGLVYKTEKAMAPHSSTLAWKIPWTEEPGGLPSMGSHRVGHDWSDLAAFYKNYLAHGGVWGGDLVILIPLSECPPDTWYHWAKVSADQKEPCKRALKIPGSENQLFFQVNTSSVPYSCETLGKLFCLSEHLFLHLKDGDNNSTYLEGILWTQSLE